MNNEILDSLRRISCGMEIVMRDVIEFELSMIEREVEKEELGEEEEEKRIKEELKVNWERIMNDIKKDYLED